MTPQGMLLVPSYMSRCPYWQATTGSMTWAFSVAVTARVVAGVLAPGLDALVAECATLELLVVLGRMGYLAPVRRRATSGDLQISEEASKVRQNAIQAHSFLIQLVHCEICTQRKLSCITYRSTLARFWSAAAAHMGWEERGIHTWNQKAGSRIVE